MGWELKGVGEGACVFGWGGVYRCLRHKMEVDDLGRSDAVR